MHVLSSKTFSNLTDEPYAGLSPGVEARLWHTLTSSDKEEVEKWTERFAVGQCVSATVFSTRDNKIDLSLVGLLSFTILLLLKDHEVVLYLPLLAPPTPPYFSLNLY